MTGVRPTDEDPDDLMTVGHFSDPIAAEFARSRLESDGLTCIILGGGLGSLLPTATMFPILLQVRAADAERATEILAEVPAADLLLEEPGPDGREPSGRVKGS